MRWRSELSIVSALATIACGSNVPQPSPARAQLTPILITARPTRLYLGTDAFAELGAAVPLRVELPVRGARAVAVIEGPLATRGYVAVEDLGGVVVGDGPLAAGDFYAFERISGGYAMTRLRLAANTSRAEPSTIRAPLSAFGGEAISCVAPRPPRPKLVDPFGPPPNVRVRPPGPPPPPEEPPPETPCAFPRVTARALSEDAREWPWPTAGIRRVPAGTEVRRGDRVIARLSREGVAQATDEPGVFRVAVDARVIVTGEIDAR